MDHEQVLNIPNNPEVLPQIPEKKSFSTKFILIGIYLSSIPLFIVFLVLFSLSIKYQNNGYVSRQEHKPQFQALPNDTSQSSVAVSPSDARVQALDDFFEKYDSPLYGHAQTIVSEADKHNIDYRLLPAIAMQESTLCKRVIKNSHNCWGFGIYGGKVTRFASFDDAITTITSTLAKKYVQKGLVNPHDIVKLYTPSDTGKWPQVVSLIMQKLSDSL